MSSHIRDLKSEIDQGIRRLLREGVKDGSIQPCDVKMTAFALAGALNWIAHWYRANQAHDGSADCGRLRHHLRRRLAAPLRKSQESAPQELGPQTRVGSDRGVTTGSRGTHERSERCHRLRKTHAHRRVPGRALGRYRHSARRRGRESRHRSGRHPARRRAGNDFRMRPARRPRSGAGAPGRNRRRACRSACPRPPSTRCAARASRP